MREDFPDLLAAAREGDDAAFTTLFRSVQPVLLRYLRTIGGRLADDVAAETWVSVVRGIERFRGDRPRNAAVQQRAAHRTPLAIR